MVVVAIVEVTPPPPPRPPFHTRKQWERRERPSIHTALAFTLRHALRRRVKPFPAIHAHTREAVPLVLLDHSRRE